MHSIRIQYASSQIQNAYTLRHHQLTSPELQPYLHVPRTGCGVAPGTGKMMTITCGSLQGNRYLCYKSNSPTGVVTVISVGSRSVVWGAECLNEEHTCNFLVLFYNTTCLFSYSLSFSHMPQSYTGNGYTLPDGFRPIPVLSLQVLCPAEHNG